MRVGLYREVVGMEILSLPGFCVSVEFNVFGLISYNFVGIIYSGLSWMS